MWKRKCHSVKQGSSLGRARYSVHHSQPSVRHSTDLSCSPTMCQALCQGARKLRHFSTQLTSLCVLPNIYSSIQSVGFGGYKFQFTTIIPATCRELVHSFSIYQMVKSGCVPSPVPSSKELGQHGPACLGFIF